MRIVPSGHTAAAGGCSRVGAPVTMKTHMSAATTQITMRMHGEINSRILQPAPTAVVMAVRIGKEASAAMTTDEDVTLVAGTAVEVFPIHSAGYGVDPVDTGQGLHAQVYTS